MLLKNKLKSTSGESIAEVLVAMLVVALGSVLFVTMVIASRNIIQKSEDAYDAYINEHNALETNGLRTDSNVQFTTEEQNLEVKKKGELISGSPIYEEKVKVHKADQGRTYFTYEAD